MTDTPYILACFDLTRKATLLSACAWFAAYQKALTLPFEAGVLVGCKADRRADAEVTVEEAQQRADTLGLHYVEVSAANGDGVEKAFEKLAQHVSDRFHALRAALEEEAGGGGGAGQGAGGGSGGAGDE